MSATADEILWLRRFSDAVRESTLKRLRRVPAGYHDWRPVPDMLSFTDNANHILELDRYLFDRLSGMEVEPVREVVPSTVKITAVEYQTIIEDLVESGKKRAAVIERLSPEELRCPCRDVRYEGEITLWWLIARGCLDHEAHHRGQMVAMLRILGETLGGTDPDRRG